MDNRFKTGDPAQIYRQMLDAAAAATEHSYCPYSNFHVGAALLTEDGQLFTGCNLENSNFADSICAERTAMAKALSQGHRQFKAIAVFSPDARQCYPCGVCRQFMSEFAGDLQIIFEGADGEPQNIAFADLFPRSL